MSSFSTEIREWNNPFLGTYLLWRFTQGYESAGEKESPQFLFHFVVLPILESPELSAPINGHRKSFASFVKSFSTNGKLDVLAKLNEKVIVLREQALLALDIGFASNLFAWNDDKTRIHALRHDDSFALLALADPIIKLGIKAFRFGTWTSSISLSVFSEFLGVELT